MICWKKPYIERKLIFLLVEQVQIHNLVVDDFDNDQSRFLVYGLTLQLKMIVLLKVIQVIKYLVNYCKI